MFRFHSKKESDEAKWYTLSTLEEGIYNKHRPAGLESRFTAQDCDLEEVLTQLKDRAQAVAAANPWVHGRLRRHPRSHRLALWVPLRQPNANVNHNSATTSSDSDNDSSTLSTDDASEASATISVSSAPHDFLQIITVPHLENTDDAIRSEANCGTGDECLEHQSPVVKLRVFCVPGSNEFLLTLSVCHQVSDATALYALWGMLDLSAEIVPLDNTRQPRGTWITSASGLWSKQKFLYSLFTMESSPLRKKHKIDKSQLIPLFHSVRAEWIAEQKEQHVPTPAVPYLSTQDVVTSWFMTTFRPACGALVVNLRNRTSSVSSLTFASTSLINCLNSSNHSTTSVASAPSSTSSNATATAVPPSFATKSLTTTQTTAPRPPNSRLTNRHVGNYLDLLILNPHEYSKPSKIRQIVATMGAASSWSLPGSGYLQGTVSCWHSLYQDLQLPGCLRHTHMPLRGGMFCLSAKPNSRMALTLFKTSSTQVAVMGFAPRILCNQAELMPLGEELVR